MEITVDNEVFVLHPGDSIDIKANSTYVIKNISDIDFKCYNVITPAMY